LKSAACATTVPCASWRRGRARCRRRHRQDLARLQAVHVVADEGVRIGAVQGDQHHVERDVDRFQLAGDAAEVSPCLDAVARCGADAGARPAGAAASVVARRCLRTGAPLAARTFRRRGRACGRGAVARAVCIAGRDLGRLRRAQFGRVEQEGVFAHQAAVIPGQLQQQVDEGLVQRLRRADAHELAAAALLDGETQRQQGRIEFDVRGAVGVGRRQLRDQAGRFVVRTRPSVRSRRAAAGPARTSTVSLPRPAALPPTSGALHWRPPR
jgi:hypothetical protein